MPLKDAVGPFIRNASATVGGVAALAASTWFIAGPRVTEWLRTELSLPANLAHELGEIQQVQEQQTETTAQLVEVQRQQQQSLSELSNATATVTRTLESTVTRIATLEEASRRDATPPIRFLEDGNSIQSGVIGDYVRFNYRYIKSRD